MQSGYIAFSKDDSFHRNPCNIKGSVMGDPRWLGHPAVEHPNYKMHNYCNSNILQANLSSIVYLISTQAKIFYQQRAFLKK